LFWELSERSGEARPWVKQTLPGGESMPPEARAELLWIDLITANDVGDNAAAQAAGRRLAPLLAEIDDPQLEGVARLALAWIRPSGGDFESALQDALDSLELLRAHHEPYWTGVAGERYGHRQWPALRPGEDELRTQIREVLGPDRSKELFAAGAELNQREAIAVAHELHAAGAPSS
jgi:hypothetical protein